MTYEVYEQFDENGFSKVGINNNRNNFMSKTDVVFYLSMVVVVWDKISEMVKPLVSNTLFSWLAIVAVVVGTVSYALYNKFTGTTTVTK